MKGLSRHRGCLTYKRDIGSDGGAVELFTPPAPRSVEPLRRHRIEAGDRLDLLASRYLGDPYAYYKIVDANPTFSPEEILEVGRVIVIPKEE